MNSQIDPPPELSTHEINELALAVLQLLSGLRVGQIREVCVAASGLANNYTRFDINQPLFQQAVAAHRHVSSELAQQLDVPNL